MLLPFHNFTLILYLLLLDSLKTGFCLSYEGICVFRESAFGGFMGFISCFASLYVFVFFTFFKIRGTFARREAQSDSSHEQVRRTGD